MSITAEKIEQIARALCVADGFDPDEEIIGSQSTNFENYGPRWQAQEKAEGQLYGPNYVRLAKGVLPLLQQGEPEGWRPIETAPKDELSLQFCICTDEEPGFIATKMVVAKGPYESLYRATHWMPLPPAPRALPRSSSRQVVLEEESEFAEIKAGDAFRNTLIERADQMLHGYAPLWHGWAIMDAFRAGAKYQRALAATPPAEGETK